jgi:ankyrin repeat protein
MHGASSSFRGCTLGIVALGWASVAGLAAPYSPVLAAPATPEQHSGVRRGWLPNLFVPAQQDERQHALAHLETAGITFEGESFVQTVRTGHRPLINLFRQAGMDVNTPGKSGRTALLTAALQRDWALFNELLQAGADINQPDASGLTPLMAVATADTPEPLKLLLDRQVALEAKDQRGHGAIHYAVAAGAPQAVDLLLAKGAKCEGTCCENRDLIDHAFVGENWKIIEAVLNHETAPPQ